MEKEGGKRPPETAAIKWWDERKSPGLSRPPAKRPGREPGTERGPNARSVNPLKRGELNLGHVDGLESFGAFAHLELHLVILL
jgi:hypothetical protein